MSATPKLPPIWRMTLYKPDAFVILCLGTLASVSVLSGVNINPIANPLKYKGIIICECIENSERK